MFSNTYAKAAIDGLVTRLSGVLAEGQTMPRRTKVGRTAESLALLSLGVAGGVSALPLLGVAGLGLIPVTATMTVAAARDLQLSILHHAAHGNVLASKAANDRLGRLIATLLVIERFDGYKPRHVVAHHGRHTVSTREDDTLRFLQDVMGLQPGAAVAVNGRRFLAGLVSPRVHLTMTGRRLRSQLVDGSWANRAATGGMLVAVVALTGATAAWLPVLLGWVLPMTVGYQAAQCARFVVEHHWPASAAPDGRRSAEEHDQLTVAVRCVAPSPARWTPLATFGWLADMALNVLVRCAVLPGDSGPSHHWHHAQARGDWANHIAEASAWEKRREAKGKPASRQAWGYRAAVRMALESFAVASLDAVQAPAKLVQEAVK